MNNLNSTDRKYLRAQAHHLEPVVLIGKNGINNGTIQSIQKVLEARELIKIKFREYKEDKENISKQIAELTASDVVGIIGHTLILFRRNPDPEKQHYTLKKNKIPL
tara:strand:+ start:85 stop:402 length:318 start_codon:yes stop_codon:yes gene_type:complete